MNITKLETVTKAQAICRVMQISWTEELEKILV